MITQLFEPESCTYTYLIVDELSKQAVLIDPVDSMLARDLAVLAERDLTLRYVLETHTHADHVTSAGALAEHTGATVATPLGCGAQSTQLLNHGDSIHFGKLTLRALHTPGHTAGSLCFTLTTTTESHVFTGDTLLINGCGRTDFQSGSAQAMYNSVTQQLFTLPGDTVVWPGHDYKQQSCSTIARESAHNVRFRDGAKRRTENEFVELMNGLNLPLPKRLHEAVPANLKLGLIHEAMSNDRSTVRTSSGYAGDVTPELAWQWMQNGEATMVDIRTEAERAWVGFVPNVPLVPWKIWPGMALNPDYDARLKATAPKDKKLLLLCRSGLRSVPAAKRAAELGFEAYNVLEGFEGDPNPNAHRNTVAGWRYLGLPWQQS